MDRRRARKVPSTAPRHHLEVLNLLHVPVRRRREKAVRPISGRVRLRGEVAIAVELVPGAAVFVVDLGFVRVALRARDTGAEEGEHGWRFLGRVSLLWNLRQNHQTDAYNEREGGMGEYKYYTELMTQTPSPPERRMIVSSRMVYMPYVVELSTRPCSTLRGPAFAE